mmetsp:Transcript_11452/g.28958  ORF Transcript_11452/g.28958 Transcript_11452/m.28958 type:complete len:251 (+) Transcript_11452:277-1029(+)
MRLGTSPRRLTVCCDACNKHNSIAMEFQMEIEAVVHGACRRLSFLGLRHHRYRYSCVNPHCILYRIWQEICTFVMLQNFDFLDFLATNDLLDLRLVRLEPELRRLLEAPPTFFRESTDAALSSEPCIRARASPSSKPEGFRTFSLGRFFSESSRFCRASSIFCSSSSCIWRWRLSSSLIFSNSSAALVRLPEDDPPSVEMNSEISRPAANEFSKAPLPPFGLSVSPSFFRLNLFAALFSACWRLDILKSS